MEIKFYDCTQENLEKVYADYVKKVNDDKDYSICTNIICMVEYTRPKINNGNPKEFIKTRYKLMTSTLEISWKSGENLETKKPYTAFSFGNISQPSVIKFARMEDIDWDRI